MKQKLIILTLLFLALSCGKMNQIAPYDYESELGSSYSSLHGNVKDLDQVYTFNALNNPSEDHLKDLTDELVDGLSGTEEKAKAIHDWIAINIFYDLDRYDAVEDLYRPYFYLEVLRSRLTMCGGYTDLFFVMAKIAGLRVAAVTGAASNNHIWNAVWDGSAWQHVDVTWDAGSYKNGKVSYKYSTNFFYKSAAWIATQTSHSEGTGFVYDEDKSPYSDY